MPIIHKKIIDNLKTIRKVVEVEIAVTTKQKARYDTLKKELAILRGKLTRAIKKGKKTKAIQKSIASRLKKLERIENNARSRMVTVTTKYIKAKGKYKLRDKTVTKYKKASLRKVQDIEGEYKVLVKMLHDTITESDRQLTEGEEAWVTVRTAGLGLVQALADLLKTPFFTIVTINTKG